MNALKLAALCTLVFLGGCSQNETKALELLLQARSAAGTDRSQAIRAYEEILAKYSRTEAAKDTRKELPPLLLRETLEQIDEAFEGFDPDQLSEEPLVETQHIKALARIVRDFPDHELADGVAAVVMYLSIMNHAARPLWKCSGEVARLRDERDGFNEVKFEDLANGQLEISAKMQTALIELFLDSLRTALSSSTYELRSLTPNTKFKSSFTQMTQNLDKHSLLMEQIGNKLQENLDWYKRDAFECTMAGFKDYYYFSDELTRARKERACEEEINQIKGEMNPLIRHLETFQNEMVELKDKADQVGGEYWEELSDLDPFSDMVEDLKSLY